MKFITILGVYLFTSLLLIQAFQAPIIYICFKMQQDYITKNLCEQRNEPITVCYGKCVLRKELSKTIDRRGKEANQPAKVKIDSAVYCLLETSTQPGVTGVIFDKVYPTYTTRLISGFIAAIFVPPRV